MLTLTSANSRKILFNTLLLGSALGALVLSDVAAAQQQPSQLEEVVVTARRRSETFQSSPVTIQAFDQQDIQSAGIERPRNFINLTSNVTLVETQNEGNAFVTIRGISQARNSEPSVAVLVDGVLESNPYMFDRQLFDIQSIQVLKGPQGAVYGRNAIGGAIVVTTKKPGDQFEGRMQVGYESGPGKRAVLGGGGPLGSSNTLKYQASISYNQTDGHIENTYLNQKADPYQDTSARMRLLWEPNDKLHTDSWIYLSRLKTHAYYFNIVPDFNVNNVSLPVRVNNPGIDNRDLSQVAFKLDYDTNLGTLTATTAADRTTEIDTGDAYDFLPIQQSFFYNLLGFDWNQSQYIKVNTVSQEVRFTSKDTGRLSWIAGAYAIKTNRFISTGNMVDTGNGVFPVYRTPSTNPLNPQITFLADGQNNIAWSVFGDATINLSDPLQLELSLRYDNDHRKNTTLTPQAFLTGAGLPGTTGEVRSHTWSEMQPKITLRYQPSGNLTIYGDYGKGFRSGGFNQTGVGAAAAAAGIVGVNDLFNAEVAKTLEFGLKAQTTNRRLSADFSVFDTNSTNAYFFVYLASTSTQNLGNIAKVNYKGYEFDIRSILTDYLDLNVGYGNTDSKIKAGANPAWIGNQAPLVTRNTTNVTLRFHHDIGNGLQFIVRADYRRLGDTYWSPDNLTVRNPVNLLDWRLGVDHGDWSVMGWERNANDVLYNAEYSPGGFVFKAPPRRWGVDFSKNF